MSIQSEINRLNAAKAELKTSIENGGVTVSLNAKIDAYPALVDAITQQVKDKVDAINGEVVEGDVDAKLNKITSTKTDLAAALAEKGQTVGDVFADYPAAVRAIETGGGNNSPLYESPGYYYEAILNILSLIRAPLIDVNTKEGKQLFYLIFISSCAPGIALKDHVHVEFPSDNFKYYGDRNSFTSEEYETVDGLITNLFTQTSNRPSFSVIPEDHLVFLEEFISDIFGLMSMTVTRSSDHVSIYENLTGLEFEVMRINFD